MLKIGLVVADSDEYKPVVALKDAVPYTEFFRTGHCFRAGESQVTALLCGIGKVNAAAAAMHLADVGCDVIVNFGLSGGISGVKRGDLCAPERFLEHDFDLTGIGYNPCEKPGQKYIYEADERLFTLVKTLFDGVKTGTAVTGDRFVCSAKERDFLCTEFDAVSCDMESAAVAYVCDMSGIPFIALRRISDDAGADAKEDYREMNTADQTELFDAVLKLIEKILAT